MVCSVNVSSTKLTNLSAVIQTCYGIEDDDRGFVVKMDLAGNNESQFYSLTSVIFSKFLNSTRTGSAHTQAGISVRTFLSSMLVSVTYFIVQVILFSILRGKLSCIYQTRTLGEATKSASLGGGRLKRLHRQFSWIPAVLFSPTEKYRERVGLDAYFFLRFLRTLTLFFLTLSIVNIPILIPIHYQSSMQKISGDPFPGLDRVNISSLVAQKSNKLVFHLILGIFAVVWFHAFLIKELRFVLEVTSTIQQETTSILLIERIPQSLLGDTIKVLSYMDSILPKCALDVRFVPKNFEELRKVYKKMLKAEDKVEAITMEIVLSKFFRGAKEKYHELSYYQKIRLQINKSVFNLRTFDRYIDRIKLRRQPGRRWLDYLAPKLSLSPSGGNLYLSLEKAIKKYEKVSAEWAQRCIELQKWENLGCDLGNRALSSQIFLDKVFVKFSSINDARALADLLQQGSDTEWKYVHLISDMRNIVWRNLKVSNPTIINLKSGFANALGVLIIVGYIIPVAFVGLISQIPYLASLTPFHSESSESRGAKYVSDIIAGIVPVITLIFLTECVPFIFWWLSHMRCKKTSAEMQSDTQNWFFAFLFVHVFLVVTISSSLSIVVEKIVNNPVSIPTMLAHDLPKSSNFFCSFILVRGLAYSGGNLLQIKELFVEFYYRLTIYTPHQRIKRMKNIPSFQWCSVYPIFSVLGCIGIVYSVISPLILPLSCVAFSLVMFSFKYLYEFQYDKGHCSESEGRLYPSSLMQIYAGIYCMEFCMIGLFALGNCFKLCICMILTLGLTILAHVKIYRVCLSRLYKFNFNQHYQNSGNLGAFSESISQRIQFPFADGKCPSQIWIPKDSEGMTENERNHLASKFRLNFETSNFCISRTGGILY